MSSWSTICPGWPVTTPSCSCSSMTWSTTASGVVSVADHLDTSDEHALLGIQVRGVFNELLLSDLPEEDLPGQLGQKKRGFFVGEATFGYRSDAIAMDANRGRPASGC